MTATKAIVERDREPVMIGNHLVVFTPHYLPGVGPRVMVVDSCPGPRNLSADDARLFASHYKLAADEAEAIAKRERMRRRGAA
jgi:hypothetical protein